MKRPIILAALIGSLALGTGVRPAAGYPVTWEFAGDVRNVGDRDGVLPESVTVGAPFSGSFTFESTTPDSEQDDPTHGIYEGALTSLSGIFGDVPFASNGLFDVTVLNDTTLPDDSFIFVGSAVFLNRIVNTSFGLTDLNATIFSSDALPLVPPSLDRLDSIVFGLNSQEEGIFIGGDVTSLVPEPGTLCLLALGALMIAKGRTP